MPLISFCIISFLSQRLGVSKGEFSTTSSVINYLIGRSSGLLLGYIVNPAFFKLRQTTTYFAAHLINKPEGFYSEVRFSGWMGSEEWSTLTFCGLILTKDRELGTVGLII